MTAHNLVRKVKYQALYSWNPQSIIGMWFCFVKKRIKSIGKTHTQIQAKLPVQNDGGVGSLPIDLVCPTGNPANNRTMLLLFKLHNRGSLARSVSS